VIRLLGGLTRAVSEKPQIVDARHLFERCVSARREGDEYPGTPAVLLIASSWREASISLRH